MVESKLLKLLSPLDKDDQSLMKLDAIFAALHIDNEDDVHRLANYFSKQETVDTEDAGVPTQEKVTENDALDVRTTCNICYIHVIVH